MKIYGVDFTCAPRRAKPITVAAGFLEGKALVVDEVERLESFSAFEAMLTRPGPWVGGFDFPFSLPRELVRDLAAHFRTRIEMRQIGVRDEAQMLGGYGSCGRPLCCTTWLQTFEPISIKMAKQQKLSLNPSKLSGMCGRLKCCLRYELPNGKGVKHGGCADEGGCGSCDNPTGPGGGCGSCGSGEGCGSCHR